MMGLNVSLDLAARLLSQVKSEKQMKGVITDLMTPPEIENLAERILVCKLLKAGKTQRAIAKELGISVTTINRGSRVLKYGAGEINKII